MAVKGYLGSLLNGLQSDVRRILVPAFEYVVDNWRFGLRADQERAENAQGYRFDGTTNSTASDEFTIQHGLGAAPYLIIPILPLDSSGGQIVPLRVTRAADANRIYLASSSTSATISLYVEV